MDWFELTVSIPVESVDTAAAVCQMVVPYGIYIEDYSDLEEATLEIAHIDLIDEELLARDRTKAVIHIYISPSENPQEALSFVCERLESEQIPYETSLGDVREEDWSSAWKSFYKPTRIGQRLVVVPTWENYAPQSGDILLRMDPGMAFGTGTHDTTRLCLEALEKTVIPGCTVLDIGTGSGILSIAALLLGAKSAVGVDIDETAVQVARENAAENHVEQSARFLCGDLTEHVDGAFDLICANIVADVIIRLAPDVLHYLAPEGRLLCSGIIDTRESDVTTALEACGLSVLETGRSGGWVSLLAGAR